MTISTPEKVSAKTDKHAFGIVVEKTVHEALEDYRRATGHRSINAVVRELLIKGLADQLI